MPKPKKATVRHLQIRLSERAYLAIDKARGSSSRQKWAATVLEKAAGL